MEYCLELLNYDSSTDDTQKCQEKIFEDQSTAIPYDYIQEKWLDSTFILTIMTYETSPEINACH